MDNVENVQRKLSQIMIDIKTWMNGKQLKLNEDKTECLIIGKRNDARRFENVEQLVVNNCSLRVTDCTKNLGIMLDSRLSLDVQVNKVVRTAGYHLRNIAFVRKYLNEQTVKMLIHNYVISRLDFCNSIYYGLPNYQLKKIQMIMNRSARLIKGFNESYVCLLPHFP